MKKPILLMMIVFLVTTLTVTGATLKLLRIELPPEAMKAKNRLILNLNDLNKILKELQIEKITGKIELADTQGYIFTVLGKIKKGKIKWSGKVIDENSLLVKFKKDYYDMIADKVKEKSKNPGLQIQIPELEFDILSTKGKISQTHEKKGGFKEKTENMKIAQITLVETMDLFIRMKYPIDVLPGELIGKKLEMLVENTGTVAAKDFNVQFVLSSDDKIPIAPATPSDSFKDDMLLKDSKKTVELLKPGEDVTITFPESIKIPADLEPGKYYLGAIADPENKIEETDENNNMHKSFMMISLPPPKSFTVKFSDTLMTYNPVDFGMKIFCKDIELSQGKEWRKCRLRPWVHQIKQVGWKDFLWEVDNIDRGVWKISTEKFCKKEGAAKEIGIKMNVVGGSRVSIPSKITLKLPETNLEYEPKTGKFRISCYNEQIAYIPFWRISRPKSFLYQFQHVDWKDFYIEVNTYKKIINKVSGVEFGKEGGTRTPLDLNLTIVK